MGVARAWSTFLHTSASAEIGGVAVQAIDHLSSCNDTGTLWKVGSAHRAWVLWVYLLMIATWIRWLMVLVHEWVFTATSICWCLTSVRTSDMSNWLRTLLWHVLELTLGVAVDKVSALPRVSAVLLVLLHLDLLNLGEDLCLSLSSIHSLAHKNVHEHDLLLLRAQTVHIVLAWTDSLTWLALNMHILVFLMWASRLLGATIVRLTLRGLDELIRRKALSVRILRISSFSTSAIFVLFVLTVWLETIIDNERWLVDIKMGWSRWVV